MSASSGGSLRPRLVLSVAILLACGGGVAWRNMPRQEDPRIASRWASLIVPFPGATVDQVARLVLIPVERALAEVDDVVRVGLTARPGVAVGEVELLDRVHDTDAAWDRVRRALDRMAQDLPPGVGDFDLDDDLVSPESVVLGVTGGGGPLERADAARRLKRDLLGVPGVRRIRIVGDSGEEIEIRADDAALRRLDLDYGSFAAQLALRNQLQSVGSVPLGDRRLGLKLPAAFGSIEEIERTSLVLPSGSAIPLGAIASVRRRTREPLTHLMRLDGRPAVGLALTPRAGIDVVRFGEALRARLDVLRPQYPGVEIHEAMFQPDHVAERLAHLGAALAIGICIVAGVLFLTMGPRLGAVVAVTVPLVIFASLACYAAGGGILHQLSIAALVISVGLVVDNAIVIAESVQRRIDEGQPPAAASRGAIRELALPLASSTATTLAAFVPMLLARGSAADFVRAIPTVVMVSLTISFLFAILVTPILSQLILRKGRSSLRSSIGSVGIRLARVSLQRPGSVLATAALVIGLCAGGALRLDYRFLPASDRSQFVVTLQLSEGSDLRATDRAAQRLGHALSERDDVRSVASFVGQAAPLFYYNLMRHPSSPHLAQLVIGTRDRDALEPVIRFTRSFIRASIPEAVPAVRKLQQGLPIDAPIEIHVYGPGLDELAQAADQVLASLRAIPGTADQYHDIGVGAPMLRFDVNDGVAGRYGVARKDVAQALLARSRGVAVGMYRGGDEPVPIVIRAPLRTTYSGLTPIEVASEGGARIGLGQVAGSQLEWRPGAVRRRDGRLVATVSSHLEPGVTSDQVLRAFERTRPGLSLPRSIELAYGGEAEGSLEANLALARVVPIGLFLMLCILLAEFNSFRRVGIVLSTVPLCAAGIVPGLLLAGQPFGFMSTLGTIALVGIVLNNAIILLHTIEQGREQGASIDDAIVSAVHLRLCPVLLTTLTTGAGLLPLAFSDTELWPPMALAIISGLCVSAILTLFVVPALYRVAIRAGNRTASA